MPNSTWLARALLVLLVLFAVVGVLDPQQRLAAINIPGDRLTHSVLSYALSLGLVAAFPRVGVLLIGSIVIGTGAVLEGLQGLGFFAGDAQWGDLVADAVGVSMALGPLILVGRRLKS